MAVVFYVVMGCARPGAMFRAQHEQKDYVPAVDEARSLFHKLDSTRVEVNDHYAGSPLSIVMYGPSAADTTVYQIFHLTIK
jgi:predicted cupin superfamily sugar epimerase